MHSPSVAPSLKAPQWQVKADMEYIYHLMLQTWNGNGQMILPYCGDLLTEAGDHPTSTKKVCRLNRCVNASYELSILGQFIGGCCPINSCLDSASKLRHFINGDVPSNSTTQNQSKPTKKLIKPADFSQILQFICESRINHKIYDAAVKDYLGRLNHLD